MKKILTLSFAVIIATASFAQYGQNRNDYPRDNGYHNPSNSNDDRRWDDNNDRWDNDRRNDRRYDESRSFTIRERDEAIARVNREYAYRIQDVKDSRYLKGRERRNRINQLEAERDQKIRWIYERFNNQRNKYNDKYYDKNYNRR